MAFFFWFFEEFQEPIYPADDKLVFKDAIQDAVRSDRADGLPALRAGALVGAHGRAHR
ncbi:hypothetical protein [Alcaligenes sp. SDU_A2]|uniref:hypothetical protein n=1 Tax=Alcaligenes sp. SDU_A2 TaxID=3136634 RepID=UPI00311EB221